MALPLTDDFYRIVVENRPLIDVRAPVEFADGAFPGAVNLPLMTDEERHLIGIRYKEAGNAAAVALGKELIDGRPRAERTAVWKRFVEAYPDAYLYCFRGGQRSEIAQGWLAEAGITIPRLKGGYKAFRRYLMERSETIAWKIPAVIVGGRTGSGKTLLLPEVKESIDLEGLARHRGSSFGRRLSGQPTQIDFENALAYRLIQAEAAGYARLVIEHESRNIGRVYIPKGVYEGFMQGEMVLLQAPMEERVDTIHAEYVVEALEEYRERFGEEGMMRWCEDAQRGLERIQRRLGHERYRELRDLLREASREHREHGNTFGYKPWIEALLRYYYDPMYDYQLEKSEIPVIFSGDREAVISYLEDH